LWVEGERGRGLGSVVYLQRLLVSEIQGDTLALQSTEQVLGILGTRVRANESVRVWRLSL
jgi:hypothetical protein